jgi:hypothetical protein
MDAQFVSTGLLACLRGRGQYEADPNEYGIAHNTIPQGYVYVSNYGRVLRAFQGVLYVTEVASMVPLSVKVQWIVQRLSCASYAMQPELLVDAVRVMVLSELV